MQRIRQLFKKWMPILTALFIWAGLSFYVIARDDNIGNSLVNCSNAACLLAVVLSWYFVITRPTNGGCCLCAALSCLLVAGVTVTGFFVSIASHKLFVIALVHAVIFFIMTFTRMRSDKKPEE